MHRELHVRKSVGYGANFLYESGIHHIGISGAEGGDVCLGSLFTRRVGLLTGQSDLRKLPEGCEQTCT
jgi:hypothetical protein